MPEIDLVRLGTMVRWGRRLTMAGKDTSTERNLTRRDLTVLFVDVVDSVLSMNRNEEQWIELFQALNDVCSKNLIPKYGGHIVKQTGDGFLVAFDAATDAVGAALELLAEKTKIEEAIGGRLSLRLGASTGQVTFVVGDLLGDAVNRAARLMQLAKPDEVNIDLETREQVGFDVEAEITDLGERWLRNFPEPIRAFRVGPAQRPVAMTLLDASSISLPRVAVLPLSTIADLGGEKFGEVIANEMILHLSRSPMLKVVSRLSAAAISRRNLSAEETCAHLNAEYLISGICQIFDGEAAITLEIASAAGAEVLTIEHLKAKTVDFFKIGNPLLGELASRIYTSIVSAELRAASHAPPSSLKAYTVLLGAVTLLHRLARSDFEKARNLLESLIHRDPRSASGHAWLAFWHAMLVHQGWSSNLKRDTFLADDASTRALELEPENAFALTVNGSVNVNLKHQPDIAEARYDEAIASNPSEALARILRSALFAFTDRGEAAIIDARAAIELAPYDPNRFMFDAIAASAHLTAEGFEDALAFAERSLAANCLHGSALRVKMVAAWRLGQINLARETCKDLMQLEPSLTVDAYAARAANAGSKIGGEIARAMREIGVPER